MSVYPVENMPISTAVSCKSSRCKVCDEQWHKHPKRRLHQTKVFPSSLDNGTYTVYS